MSDDFQARYRAEVSRREAEKRRKPWRKKTAWDMQYLGLVKRPTRAEAATEQTDGPSSDS